ncbi:MAG TPA: transketolase C-terminal domain-containing protein [Candidatus Bilamarchaeaceae archaeon]|nr:transketolase C-terminal domain-containing protein [Candidatus Bilamarchaeaceae archaeon]
MRNSFTNVLYEIFKKDKSTFLVSADMGFSFFERFQQDFPDRFLNTGVAEANMIGISAGLALSGKTVFSYSISTFLTMRCFEQIRDDVCNQNANVKLVGSGGGLTYGSLGPTHHAVEDISIMRSLANMVVICPGDPIEAELCARAVYSYHGPAYIRLGRNGDPHVHTTKPLFTIGKSIIVKKGSDITIIATGNMLKTAHLVSLSLEKRGISTRLISMHTIKPIDQKAILKAALDTKAIFSIEEHSIIGGLGSATAEVLADNGVNIIFKRFALPDMFCKYVGSHQYLRDKNGLGESQIYDSIINILVHNQIIT